MPSRARGVRRRPFRHVTFTLGLAITLALARHRGAEPGLHAARPARDVHRRRGSQGPSAAHPLGTDQFGRDLLSRIMTGRGHLDPGRRDRGGHRHAGWASPSACSPATSAAGSTRASCGWWTPSRASRPSSPRSCSPRCSGPALAITHGRDRRRLPARLRAADPRELPRVPRPRVRGGRPRARGAGTRAVIGRHILPNTLPPLIVQATISFPVAILAEAGLSYLGLGTQPPHPSWGLMLREARPSSALNPWYRHLPGWRDRADCAGAQPAGRRAQGSPRSQDGRVTCLS